MNVLKSGLGMNVVDIEQLTAFLGWVSAINIALLFLSTCALIIMRETIANIHTALFGLDEQDLGRVYFQYIAQYKIAIIMLNVSPYLVLKFLL